MPQSLNSTGKIVLYVGLTPNASSPSHQVHGWCGTCS